ncbi:exodeoxyribonuclease VII small subunit [Modicisalibacter sp. 'Wilcox']|uniref:exodeoxyribonuclease VII small subunit n=1 Tax=Modicisalibacter sp. 'Wilcox' TaxID=2679914 RepID=UPI0013D16C84|nr:exodeoxyribonuclease VII small subunit [Modicisalibacter sp. 'Wilcox']
MADQETAAPGADEATPDDFAGTLDRLEQLVARLEAGELSLEASLAAFEQGVRLTREAQQRLDAAELQVRALMEQPDGSLADAPFGATDASPEDGHAR